jgi:protein-S-isoprenylcysteine O-methyltransferase Ste14
MNAAAFFARWRVRLGYPLAIAVLWVARPTPQNILAGALVGTVGLWIRARAAGHLHKQEILTVTGPYAFTRNPLYLGTLITALGLAAAGRSLGLAVLFSALFALVYLPAIELEEQHLSAILPGYAAFAQRVPLLVPRWPSNFGTWRFSAALYRKNREYEALGGWLVGVLWLAARTWWFTPAL